MLCSQPRNRFLQPLFALKMIGRAHSDYIVAAIVVASEVEHKPLLEAIVVVVSLRDLGVVGLVGGY